MLRIYFPHIWDLYVSNIGISKSTGWCRFLTIIPIYFILFFFIFSVPIPFAIELCKEVYQQEKKLQNKVSIIETQCSAGVISWEEVLYQCLHSASTIQTSISAWCSLYGVDMPSVLSLIQGTPVDKTSGNMNSITSIWSDSLLKSNLQRVKEKLKIT